MNLRTVANHALEMPIRLNGTSDMHFILEL